LTQEVQEGSWVVVEHDDPWKLVLEGAGRGCSVADDSKDPWEEVHSPDWVSAGGDSTWSRIMQSLGGEFAGFADIPTLEQSVKGLEVGWLPTRDETQASRSQPTSDDSDKRV